MIKYRRVVSASATFLLLFTASQSASSQQNLTSELISNKITFDLSVISADGLMGASDSLRAIDYEFCIPADEQLLGEILAIDPKIQSYPHSRGRIGCNHEQYLCISNTHNPRWKDILQSITKLDYVKKITQTDWE
jgi:hypothetical protein